MTLSLNTTYNVGNFNDERLNRAGSDLYRQMINKQSVCIRKLGGSRAGEVRFGRFLGNKKVHTEELIETLCRSNTSKIANQHVLLIQDTTEINLAKKSGRTKGLGTVGNGEDKGFFVHPLLAVDAEEGSCLGLAHLKLWQRTKSKATNYQRLPIEEKESYRWIETALEGKARLNESVMKTLVSDRESDIYELFDRVPDEMTHVLIRARHNRWLLEDKAGHKLFDWIKTVEPAGHYSLEVPSTGKRAARHAQMSVRFDRVTIKKAKTCSKKGVSPNLEVTIIDVVEDASNLAETEQPIHWKLLTTHQVTCLEEAIKCIQWYRQRWHIEQVFRSVKRQGLNIEASDIETAERLEKLTVLAFSAAVQVMQLVMAREGSVRPSTDIFEESDTQLLSQLQTKLEGKTDKQKNHYPPKSLAWSSWIIARLGGWKGYKSEAKPGPKTMLRGLESFASIREGWLLATRFD